MNNVTFQLVRTAALAAAFVTLSVTGRAGESPSNTGDKANHVMHLIGWVQVESVSGISVGSPMKAVFEELGTAEPISPEGTWLIRKEFHVEHSAAHGALAVSFTDGRVSALRIVSASFEVDLMANRANAFGNVLVASSR